MSDPFAAQRLDGKVLVITGGTQGLGAAIAERAAELGAAGAGQAADWLEEADAGRPFGSQLRPADIAPMVTYLLSDAAAMVTG